LSRGSIGMKRPFSFVWFARRGSKPLFFVAVFCGVLQAQGIVTTVAGTDYAFPITAKQGITAPLGRVADVAVDSQGNVYFSDPVNAIIGRVTPDGDFTVVVGNGIRAFSGDGGPA